MDENYHNQANTAPTAAEQTALPLTPPSEFRGKTIQLIGWRLLGLLLTAVTLGIGAPWAYCMVLRWQIKHTYINGKQLYFDGTGLQLLGKGLLWGLLTIVTLGIYVFFIPVRMHRWKAQHTRFAKPGDKAQDKASITFNAVVFGCIFAAVALVALIVVAILSLTGSFLTEKQPEPTTSGLVFPNGDSSYQLIIDADGNYIIVSPNGGDNLIVTPGGDGGTFVNPGGEEDSTTPTAVAPPPTTEAKPTTVTGPIVGNWIMIGKHVSGSWESSEYYFASDGTFRSRSGSLYDYHAQDQSWSYFLGRNDSVGWYTYDDGVLTMHFTRFEAGPSSEGDRWHDYTNDHIVTHQVSFSSDNQVMRFVDVTYSEGGYTEYLGYYNRMVGNAEETLAHYYPQAPQ